MLSLGINGDSTCPYILNSIEAVRRKGWRSVVMNWRGKNGTKLKVALTVIDERSQ